MDSPSICCLVYELVIKSPSGALIKAPSGNAAEVIVVKWEAPLGMPRSGMLAYTVTAEAVCACHE